MIIFESAQAAEAKIIEAAVKTGTKTPGGGGSFCGLSLREIRNTIVILRALGLIDFADAGDPPQK
jgi:hypothetical protein